MVIHFIGVVAASICIYRYVRDKDENSVCDEDVNENSIVEPIESYEEKVDTLAEKRQKNNAKEEFKSLLEEGYNIGVLDKEFIEKFKENSSKIG